MPIGIQSKQAADDEFCCFRLLLDNKSGQPNKRSRQADRCNSTTLNRYQQHFVRMTTRKLRNNRDYIALNSTRSITANGMLIVTAVSMMILATPTANCLSASAAGALSTLEPHQAAYLQQQQHLNHHHHQHHHHQQAPLSTSVQMAQTRAGGLEPGDYVDEAGELEVLASQQQIPTAQLMAAAGHIVPENFFLPGGSIPALYAQRYQQQSQQQQQQLQQQQQHQHHHQHQQQQQQHHHSAQEQIQQAASQVQARHVAPSKYIRQADLMAAAEQGDQSPLIDFNAYNLIQQEARDSPMGSQVDLVDYIGSPAGQSAALFEQQQQHYAEQQVAAELAALAAANQQHHQQQHNLDHGAHSAGNENVPAESIDNYSASIGPAYQISGMQSAQEQYGGGGQFDNREQQKPYGLPTKSSSREPSGMLKPLGNPKTISSPVIDFMANQMPKTSSFEKLAEKLPQPQTPTVFSFASSKDPSEKVKQVNQKKRNVMRQAEQLARMMIKSVNDKFGTTIGDQSDIPFLLSSIGPLGMAQNLLFDPTLLVTLLNSAEKTYFSDVLPSPAKSAIRPVLNIFRVPNKKRDKANLSNIISFIASGGQTPASTPPKHRQGTGVEKMSKNKSSS